MSEAGADGCEDDGISSLGAAVGDEDRDMDHLDNLDDWALPTARERELDDVIDAFSLLSTTGTAGEAEVEAAREREGDEDGTRGAEAQGKVRGWDLGDVVLMSDDPTGLTMDSDHEAEQDNNGAADASTNGVGACALIVIGGAGFALSIGYAHSALWCASSLHGLMNS